MIDPVWNCDQLFILPSNILTSLFLFSKHLLKTMQFSKTSLLCRLQAQTLPDATLPIVKI